MLLPLFVACTHSHSGDVVLNIEYNQKYGFPPIQCDYYTNVGGLCNFPVTAPCSLYKVGDTLKLK